MKQADQTELILIVSQHTVGGRDDEPTVKQETDCGCDHDGDDHEESPCAPTSN